MLMKFCAGRHGRCIECHLERRKKNGTWGRGGDARGSGGRGTNMTANRSCAPPAVFMRQLGPCLVESDLRASGIRPARPMERSEIVIGWLASGSAMRLLKRSREQQSLPWHRCALDHQPDRLEVRPHVEVVLDVCRGRHRAGVTVTSRQLNTTPHF